VIVYGRHPVREAIRGPRTVTRVWVTKAAAREPWLAAGGADEPADADRRDSASTTSGPRIDLLGSAELTALAGSDGHQGMCAEVSPYRYADAGALIARPSPLLVALDQVQDPQNLGSICRTAECAGAAGVILPERRSAEVTPAVCKASAGAVEHLPVAIVRNLADFLAVAKRAGLWCYGADGAARTRYDAVDYSGGVVLVLGSEGTGLRPRVAGACDALIALPLHGRVESLSVGAAAAVLLYAAAAVRAKPSSA
jgi:23S rRNA (guanosine2251-2'-O)-methyltransferase